MKKVSFLIAAVLLITMRLNAQEYKVHYKPVGERNIIIKLKNSNVKITGYDGDDVIITSTKEDGGKAVAGNDLSVENKKDVLFIDKKTEAGYSYIIRIPRKTNLRYEEEFRSPKQLEINNITGNVRVKSWMSKIVLNDISGTISATSQSADIVVVYSSSNQVAADSLVSAGRLVDVTLPSKIGVDLALNVSSGKVTSDFDLGEANKKRLAKLGTIRQINTLINNGGVKIYIKANEVALHRK